MLRPMLWGCAVGKYTDGPWLIAGVSKTFVYALGPKGTNVFWCDVHSAGKEKASPAECAANARLISAAPELLEALEAAVECGMVPASSAADNGASRYYRQVHVVYMIRAAIKKAKGE